MHCDKRLKIAVVGSGVSGLSAAWLLSKRHEVTLYEESDRIGGHANTVSVCVEGRQIPVDTGFIVFNRKTYPNFVALLDFLGVETQPSDMSFAVSMEDGAFEYSGSGLRGLFGQVRNAGRLRFWSMIADLVRFYRYAAADPIISDDPDLTLGDYLRLRRYGRPFREDHLLPMASAIWSAPVSQILSYPAAAFIRFNENHGLLQIKNRPAWETVAGGSRVYVDKLAASLARGVRLGQGGRKIRRFRRYVTVEDAAGEEAYDHVVVATGADQALRLLCDPTQEERSLLGAFNYSSNLAVLHCDESFMPKRRRVWSSWNYIQVDRAAHERCCVTYWMNTLQQIESVKPLFLTLNPVRPPRAGTLLRTEVYHHPVFNRRAIAAQNELWSLQGVRKTWFCGSYFGSGFHEDGLQAGLAVAERLGGVRRPWKVPNESSRIVLGPASIERALSGQNA